MWQRAVYFDIEVVWKPFVVTKERLEIQSSLSGGESHSCCGTIN